MTKRLEHLKQQIEEHLNSIDPDDHGQAASGIKRLTGQVELSHDELQELRSWLLDQSLEAEVQGTAHTEAAETYEDVAETLRRHGAKTIGDLPPAVQQEVVTRLEMALALLGEENR